MQRTDTTSRHDAASDAQPSKPSLAPPADGHHPLPEVFTPPSERTPLQWIKHGIKLLIGVRLGVLEQYKPRPMKLPAWYARRPALQNPPKISIVTPSFRQGAYIERTVRSVFDQDYPNLEYIVQDGGSKDETVAVLERYANRLKHWESAPDKGQTNAINLGFRHATGAVMGYLNSDDLLLPGALHAVAEFFARRPDVDVVYGHRIIVDEHDGEIGRWIMPPHRASVLSWADFIPQETMFWRRSLWEKVGGRVDESFRFAMDWDLLLRFRDAGARMVRLPRFLGAFRVHVSSKTVSAMQSQGVAEMNRLRHRALGYLPTPKQVRYATLPYVIWHAGYDKLHRLGLYRV